jgi:hypothetical protein
MVLMHARPNPSLYISDAEPSFVQLYYEVQSKMVGIIPCYFKTVVEMPRVTALRIARTSASIHRW